MWNLKQNAILALLSAFAVLGSEGCSMQSAREGDSSLYLDLSSLRGDASRFSLLDSGGSLYGLGAPPTNATGFSCYAVNVTGPGISDSSVNPQGDLFGVFDRLLKRESFCSYRGVVSGTFSLSGSGPSEVALQVPPGGLRLIQLAGVNDPLVCASGVVDGGTTGSSSGGGRYYEVGRTVLTDVFGDRSADLSMDWPTTTALQAARMMDCGGGSCNSVSNVPVGTSASQVLTASTKRLAFKVPTVGGKYIRRLTLVINSYTAGTGPEVHATVTLKTKAPGGAMSTLTSTGYSRSLLVPLGATPAPVEFDLSLSSTYYMMNATQEYWIELSSSDAQTPGSTTSGLMYTYNKTPTSNSDVQLSPDAGATWAPFNLGASPDFYASGIPHDLFGCGN